jgi:hypothetical protein
MNPEPLRQKTCSIAECLECGAWIDTYHFRSAHPWRSRATDHAPSCPWVESCYQSDTRDRVKASGAPRL